MGIQGSQPNFFVILYYTICFGKYKRADHRTLEVATVSFCQYWVIVRRALLTIQKLRVITVIAISYTFVPWIRYRSRSIPWAMFGYHWCGIIAKVHQTGAQQFQGYLRFICRVRVLRRLSASSLGEIRVLDDIMVWLVMLWNVDDKLR